MYSSDHGNVKVCLLPTFANEVGVTNVDGVVDAESDGEHNGDTGDDVDCEAPEVEHAHDIHQRQHHAHQHQQANSNKKKYCKIKRQNKKKKIY